MSSYREPVEAVLQALTTDATTGLSTLEASARLKRYGSNELAAERPVPGWRRFLQQFQDPLVILLLVATAVSTTLWVFQGDSPLPYEAIAIFAVVVLNAVMGHVQRARAEQAVAALRRMSAAQATAMRDGARVRVAASELVPGDIILIEEGDTIPADGRLIGTTALQTAEAALTGESLPVTKHIDPISEEVSLGDRHNMIFSGTAATYGRGLAVVTATGMQSEIGKIAGMLQGTPQEATPLQKELARVARLLGIVVIAIAVVMIATILLVEKVRGLAALFDVLLFGVALAVAAVPEGLPAVVTAVLALGVQRMAKRNAIVRHLAAVETLGSADVIASDKTARATILGRAALSQRPAGRRRKHAARFALQVSRQTRLLAWLPMTFNRPRNQPCCKDSCRLPLLRYMYLSRFRRMPRRNRRRRAPFVGASWIR